MVARVVDIIKPNDYFQSQISDAAQHLKISLKNELEFYLVNLLVEFITPDKTHELPDGMDIFNTPLAFFVKKGLESSPENQLKIFKRLGDSSLYFAGYFQDYFNRKTFDVDYYISMGSSAYDLVSRLLRDRYGDETYTEIYSDLASDFKKFVDIIAKISHDHNLRTNNEEHLLHTYIRWTKTNSDFLRQILEDHGIIPMPINLKIAQ